jgi:hypothetical protein
LFQPIVQARKQTQEFIEQAQQKLQPIGDMQVVTNKYEEQLRLIQQQEDALRGMNDSSAKEVELNSQIQTEWQELIETRMELKKLRQDEYKEVWKQHLQEIQNATDLGKTQVEIIEQTYDELYRKALDAHKLGIRNVTEFAIISDKIIEERNRKVREENEKTAEAMASKASEMVNKAVDGMTGSLDTFHDMVYEDGNNALDFLSTGFNKLGDTISSMDFPFSKTIGTTMKI